MSMLWSIWLPWQNEWVPRQQIQKWCHDNISVLVVLEDTGAKGSVDVRNMKEWRGVIPVAGCPVGQQHGKRGGTSKDNSDMMQTQASHTTQMHSFMGGRLDGYTFEVYNRDDSGSMGCRGSRRSQDGRNLSSGTHGLVGPMVTVVVHGSKRNLTTLRPPGVDGSRTWWSWHFGAVVIRVSMWSCRWCTWRYPRRSWCIRA